MSIDARFRAGTLRYSLRALFVALTIVAVFAGFAMYLHAQVSRQRRLMESSINLRQVGIALHNYNAALGCFPSQVLLDSNGLPYQGWRGLLSPYVASISRGPHYDTRQAWNSPHNLQFKTCPTFCGSSSATEACFVAVIGNGTVFNGPHASRESDLKRGLSNVISLIEVANSGIRWAEPKDLTEVDFNQRFINREVGPHDDGFLALFADGSVQFIEYDRDLNSVLALFRID